MGLKCGTKSSKCHKNSQKYESITAKISKTGHSVPKKCKPHYLSCMCFLYSIYLPIFI